MKFKLIDARGHYYGDVIIYDIEDLRELQYVNDYNVNNDKLVIDFKLMTITIYNDYIE